MEDFKETKNFKKTLLLAITKDVYESFDESKMSSYIKTQIEKYHEDTLVEPYIILEKNEAMREYEENKEDYPTKEEYYMKYYGGYLNENGDVVSEINQEGIFSEYIIESDGLTFFNIVEMIISEKININYILHEGKLYDKANDKSISKLSDCDNDSYFIIISVI